MNIIKLLCTVSIAFFLTKCKEIEPHIITIKGAKSPKLRGRVLEIDKGCYSNMKLLDSCIVLIDGCGLTNFKIVNKNSRKNILSFGKEGKAPDQYWLPEIIETNYIEDGCFWIHDVNNKKIKRIEIDDVIANETYIPKTSFFCGADILGSCELNLDVSNGMTFFGIDHLNGKGDFFIYKRNESKLNWISFFKESRSNMIPNEKKAMAHYAKLRKDSNNIILGFRYFNRIHKYSDNGDLEDIIQIGEKDITPNFKEKSKYYIPENVVSHILDIEAIDSKLYILYSGYKQEQLRTPLKLSNKLIVFESFSKPTNVYNFDRYIYDIEMDDNGEIYGLSVDQDGFTNLVVYDLYE